MRDPLKPDAALLCKLGSIVVHADEVLSPGGHEFDRHALSALLADPDVQTWLGAMGELALVPVKRSPSSRAPSAERSQSDA